MVPNNEDTPAVVMPLVLLMVGYVAALAVGTTIIGRYNAGMSDVIQQVIDWLALS